MKGIDFENDDNQDWAQEEKDQATAERRDAAILSAADAKLIMDCRPRGLYYQYMAEIDEADYYFQIDFPRGAKTIKIHSAHHTYHLHQSLKSGYYTLHQVNFIKAVATSSMHFLKEN